MIKRIIFLHGLLLLASCSSVPLGSMVKLATFDESDLVNIRPQQVQARITLNHPAQLQTRDVRLGLRYEYRGDSEQEYSFLLSLEASELIEDDSWLIESPNRHRYTFSLSKESIAEFRQYQRDFVRYGKPDKYYWTVYYFLKQRPANGQSLDLDLELKLSEKDSFFFLLKGAEVDVE